MPPPVHILVSCRNSKLWRASTLVFDTLRTGFPDAEIFVDGNALYQGREMQAGALAEAAGASFANRLPTVHHQWIRRLIEENSEPFFICDTDVVFHSRIEPFDMDAPLVGRWIPSFHCPFTETLTHSRLHTALLFINPAALRAKTPRTNDNHPFSVFLDLVSPLKFALDGKIHFHDTLGQAYHAVGGLAFGEATLDAYDHLNCGTYLDLLDEQIPGAYDRQAFYLKNPALMRGLRKEQAQWYEQHAA